jgi:hypothetical protein
MTTRGTMSTLVRADSSSNAKVPKATSPDPCTRTSSSTRAVAAISRQAAAASCNREGPWNSKRSASPSPTMPSPRRRNSSGRVA